MAEWSYQQQQPGLTYRDPISGEFFSTEAISNSAEALSREGLQNTLDARIPGQRARVRIFLSGPTGAAAADVAPFFQGAWPHLQARGNGLREIPAENSACPFLVFEDFGTTGLEGDPTQWHPMEGFRNGFFTFFRGGPLG